MTKKDLRNGDIVVIRDGELGLYLAEKDVFIYKECGYEDVDCMFNDDLTCIDTEVGDVMQVYREEYGVISFFDYEEGDLVFERDETWERPTKEQREAMAAAAKAEYEAKEAELRAEREERNKNSIRIISQAFYGNRTGTEITVEEMDRFILGYLTDKFPVREKIDRTIIRIPDSENVVFIYNKYKEEKRREELGSRHDRERFILASIPEKNIELFSRCIVCRMNEDGEFASLEREDYEKFMKYLAR